MTIITVIGSLNYDITTYINLIPSANETNLADDVQYNLGGKGFNQCIGLTKSRSNANVEIRMIGSIGGKDNYGDFFLENLKLNKVLTSDIKKIENSATGLANIIVESGRNHANRIMVFPGANKYTKFNETELEQLFSNDDEEFIVLQNEIPDPLSIINHIINPTNNYDSKFIIYNPSPFNAVKYVDPSMWSNINVLIVNEIEMFQLAQALNVVSITDIAPDDKDDEFVQFFEKLIKPVASAIKYPSTAPKKICGIIVVTLGGKGYIYYNHYTETLKYEPASKLIAKPIDSTGCGDTFLGYFTTILAETLSDNKVDLDGKILNSLKIANIAAGIAITRNGASSSIPSIKEVKNLI
ncbi:hypothetical protein ACO0SA_002485 [Hanseniaspora valbyensis]